MQAFTIANNQVCDTVPFPRTQNRCVGNNQVCDTVPFPRTQSRCIDNNQVRDTVSLPGIAPVPSGSLTTYLVCGTV